MAYTIGIVLEVRGERWRVARVARSGTCTVLTLDGRERANARTRLRVIDPFDRPRRIAAGRLRRRPRRAVLEAALLAAVSHRRIDGLWTAAGASIELWPYQLEPALAAIGGATRFLLADAVGLGKTIQAGLLLSELQERGWVEHALIVCPAGLRDTWALELRERFGIIATILDQPAIADRIASMPPGVSPWSGHAVAIASIDFVKRPEVLDAIEREPRDLLIVDEAHHLSPGTDRGAAVSALAARAPWCVLLSATPHSGDAAAFAYLCEIGSTGEPLTIFRRSRSDVGLTDSRHARFLAIRPTAGEATLLEGVDRYARAIWRARGHEDAAVRLLAITLARRAASSAAAIERSLVRRLALLTAEHDEPTQARLPWDDEDEDEVEPDAILAAPGLTNAAEERLALQRLIEWARLAGSSSKFGRLERLLNRIKEPVVVFTEYRDTLAALGSRLSQSLRVGVVHGALTRAERRCSVDAFNGGSIDVLVATDAAGEGLNLHHRCRLVVDIELPWNPLRLEQRVGRVDRLGQQRTVHAIRMFYPGTIEERVLEHLQLRRRRANEAVGRVVSEGDVARAVFETGALVDRRSPAIHSERITAAAEESLRAVRQREVQERCAAGASRCWSMAPRSRVLTIVHRSAIANVAGAPLGELVAARRVELTRPPAHRREWQRLIERLDASIRARALDARFAPAARTELERRIAAIRDRLSRQRAKEQQRSLFDGRADADALCQASLVAGMDAALARTLAAVFSPPDRDAAQTEMVAAWSERLP
ncbi:MAG TPA: helicase-related protein [Vicinamibacterales bacterium]